MEWNEISVAYKEELLYRKNHNRKVPPQYKTTQQNNSTTVDQTIMRGVIEYVM
jgi:hypothetical protein